MGHDGACVYDDPNHPQRCRTYVVPPVTDLAQTRWWVMDGDYWRTNKTAPVLAQVEFRRDNGTWGVARAWPNEQTFLLVCGHVATEITAGEVPPCPGTQP